MGGLTLQLILITVEQLTRAFFLPVLETTPICNELLKIYKETADYTAAVTHRRDHIDVYKLLWKD